MARKYDLISELYARNLLTMTATPENWLRFLRSACYNFRLRFDEQVLVFAQRPDATAVLEIEIWNRQFGRWVNKGARGIAVFEEFERKNQRLKHYFDISDTHEGARARPVPVWQMKPEYEDDVIETLESTFGKLPDKQGLAAAIRSAVQNMVEDNITDYVDDLLSSAETSRLEGLDAGQVTELYRKVVYNSVSYMLMERLGIDTKEQFDAADFNDVTRFNTCGTVNAIGFLTSDISEMMLFETARTVRAADRASRSLAAQTEKQYHDKTKHEGSADHERDHLHDAGRLPASESDAARAAGSGNGQVRADEETLSEGEAQNPVLQPADELQAGRASGGDRAESLRDGADADQTDGADRGRDRAPESDGYDGLGTSDELDPEQGAGDRTGGGHLRLDWYDRSHEDKSLPFFGGDETINEILGTTPHLKASKEVIRQFYETHLDNGERTDYIRSIFNNDYTEVILSDGRRCGYKTYENVLHLWEGSYLSRTKQGFYDWGVIAQHFEAMRLLEQLYDTMKPLPDMGQQQILMEKAEEKSPAFSFSQEIIDAVLTRGSGVSEGKMRIYEQFQKSLSSKENADFLKNEYGWGGSYPVIAGAGIDEQHDGKGIRITKGIGNDKPHVTLKWTQVEKRIGELIRMDRYLNPKEKEMYPEWLERQEERRREQAERDAVREALKAAPPEKEETQAEVEHYEYHLGDKVYLGASEYEILSFDENRVMLYDTTFPLFNKEVECEEFDRKVKENPLNDHLKVRGVAPERKSAENETDKLGNTEETIAAVTDENPLLAQAKQLIDEFCREEYEREEGADYSDLGSVEVAYTTTEDEQHEIQAVVNLETFSISTYVDGQAVRTEQYDSLEQLIENELTVLSFNELTDVSDEELAPFYEKEEPVKPAWEHKHTRVQTFDLHPDIPMSERNTFDLACHEVEEVGKKERFRRNLMAIQLLKKCQSENRFATPDEQEILSKYVGWGGIPEAFDENNSSWGTEFLELKTVLTPEEYHSARESTLTAFYTPPAVIQAIYKVMGQMGFQNGNILEPSCGIGNFIGMLPLSMQESKLYGVEIDPVSAGIAQQLYQRASIAASAFEDMALPDSFFDAVVGNVPFGDFGVSDKRYDKYHFLIHDFFFGATRS